MKVDITKAIPGETVDGEAERLTGEKGVEFTGSKRGNEMYEDYIHEEQQEELEKFLYYWGVQNERTVAEELLKHYSIGRWITDRNPFESECEYAGDTGFILCVSGQRNHIGYDHAIVMGDCTFEEGQWFISGIGADGLTIHGWMLPPEWEGKT